MGIPHIRRASEDESGAIAALVPGLVPSATDDHHATFVIDGAAGPVAVLDLLQGEGHLELLHLVAPDLGHARALHDFAEAAARALRAREIRLRPRAMSDEQSRALGYRNGVKRVAADGVPLWRDGVASFSQSLYYRGTWAALALLTGLGSVSIAVFSGGGITLAHIVIPALLCIVGTLFALWQILLVVMAARRVSGSLVALSGAIAATTAVLIGSLLYDRALPALTELWNIQSGDAKLGDLAVTASPDGRTLYVSGPYGMRSEEAVRKALEQHKSLREVVLEGPGGRASAGFEIFRMIRSARLATRVDTTCASACTIAFLGGIERTISPSGRLGFHRASFPGMDDDDMHESNRGIRNFLVYSARLTPEFARKVIETPAASIWVPTRAELLAGKVITR
jgi:hypothetical protein